MARAARPGPASAVLAIGTLTAVAGCMLLPPPIAERAPETREELIETFERAGISVSEDLSAKDALRTGYGTTCFTESSSFALYDPELFDREIADAGITSGWLDDYRWVGTDPAELAGQLGSSAVALSRGIWLIVPEPDPHALEIVHVPTPDGFDVWVLQDNVRGCPES